MAVLNPKVRKSNTTEKKVIQETEKSKVTYFSLFLHPVCLDIFKGKT